ncbi:uncharacterized protein LOC119084162 [Bradysia coprophila]|uniref:uncharacterized protein LOC119084162 n=1 Tax=Bradysia coprophila TaxID=38358 RepID=UPI00187D70E1|nr:uncharacterized protein LOC119084162 [Bradysia coprophila]
MIRLIILMLHLIVYGVWSSSPTALPTKSRILISTNCSRELFNIKLDLDRSFKGVIFPKDFSDECRVKGDYSPTVEIHLPTSGCGIRSETPVDGLHEFSVHLIIQMDEKLRQSSDLQRIVRCSVSTEQMTTDIPMAAGTKKKSSRNGRMHGTIINETERIQAWLELGGNDGSGAVEVGQQTSMNVKVILPDRIDVRVIDCVALDGIGEASQKLFDERGCPIDEQVMPALTLNKRYIEEGWSKPSKDDIVEKLFTATFPAFKFPDRERLHVNCGVQLCREQCPTINCTSNDEFLLNSTTRLSRLQVFNSLAVTAPQIEIDRVRSNGAADDVTIDEYPPKVRSLRSDGILCMSTSKLAISFCILGMIFLIAVIVSIVCLLRARARSKESTFLTTNSVSMFSSSSSSNSRIESRLLIPYGGTLPYAQVY